MSSVVDTIGNVLGIGPAQQSQSQDAGAQSGAINAQTNIANTLSGPLSQYYAPAIGAEAANAGISSNGSYNPNYDPYSQDKGSIISQYESSVQPQYNNAISEAQHDAGDRFGGQANSLLPSEVGTIRNTQAQDINNYTQNLGIDAVNTQQQRVGNLISSLMGGASGGMSGNSSAAGIAGNNYGLAQNQANSAANNIFSIAGLF